MNSRPDPGLLPDGELLVQGGAAAGIKAGIGRYVGQPALVVVDIGLAALHQAVLAEGFANTAVECVVAVVNGFAEGEVGDADLLAGVVVAVGPSARLDSSYEIHSCLRMICLGWRLI